MKKIILIIMSAMVLGCSRDEVVNHDNINIESKVGVIDPLYSYPPITDRDVHKEMLNWNAFIVGEILRDRSDFRSHFFNNLDTATGTVDLEDLIDFTTDNVFSNLYRYYAENSIFQYVSCNPDESAPWPPLIPPADDNIPSTNSVTWSIDVNKHVSRIISNPIQLYVPNADVFIGESYTVGHPLLPVTNNHGDYNYGRYVYSQPNTENNMACVTHVFSELCVLSIGDVYQDKFIIVSRPTITSVSNYPYINFDITKFLERPVLGDGGSLFE
ncbi:hypothetical protein [Nonlabens sp. Asnod3-H03]|uniref:hypothetical protein n=1 Tax=Nonlabens sp. Asnod3-H03 TaxID=3160580 RepID=UPI0038675DFE